MRRAVEKLKSRSGASFSIALLLFLVCTVVGSVLLAAATTAAGRMSRMAEMDRRYYRVSSAASLLAEELSGEEKKVTVERSKTTDRKVTQHYTVTERTEVVTPAVTDPETGEVTPAVTTTVTETTPGATSTAYTGKYNTTVAGTKQSEVATGENPSLPSSATGVKVDTDSMSLLTRCAVELMYGGSNCNTDAAMNYSFSAGISREQPGSLTLTPSGMPGAAGSLTVSGSYVVQKDGTLVLTVWDGDTPTDRYQLTVTLEPHVAETQSSTSSTSGPVVKNSVAPTLDGASGGFDRETITTTTLTKKASVYWTVKSIQ